MQRILLVDDDEDIRQLLELGLRSVGYRLDSAASVAAALSRLEERNYTLLVVDKRLPDGNGLEIADIAAARGTKVIVLSGYVLTGSAADLDRHEHVMKPIRPRELVDLVKQRIGAPRRLRDLA